jgi:hypothetical protein
MTPRQRNLIDVALRLLGMILIAAFLLLASTLFGCYVNRSPAYGNLHYYPQNKKAGYYYGKNAGRIERKWLRRPPKAFSSDHCQPKKRHRSPKHR